MCKGQGEMERGMDSGRNEKAVQWEKWECSSLIFFHGAQQDAFHSGIKDKNVLILVKKCICYINLMSTWEYKENLVMQLIISSKQITE